ncbi:MAG TPA: hypothetical protein VL326_08490 [Kofleriaceae bacterium]|jgi:hypothetical protein|nr:hypothetical protein [Kofleriaceae bacterium]
MRRIGLILVGISALGCRDPGSGKPTAGSAQATAPTPAPKQITPDPTPALPAGSAAPAAAHDQAWKDAMAKTIKAVAPDLSDVKCGDIDCSATLTAATEEELVARAEKLQDEDSLRQLEARGVTLSAPTKKDGKASMTVRVLFDD